MIHHRDTESTEVGGKGWRGTLARVMSLAILFCASPAFAQRGGEVARNPRQSAAAFQQRAWRLQEGKLRVISDIEPENARATFDKTRWLLSTIEVVFAGMATRRPSDGLEVFYAADRNDYLSLIATEVNGDGSNTAGMAAYGGRRTMLFVKGLAWGTIQHEAWHASRSVFIPNMPTWLDEGIAEVFEKGAFLDDQFTIGGIGADDLRRVKALLETDNWVPLGEFVRDDGAWNLRLRNGDVSGFAQYVQAWAICHFLLFADDGEHRGRLNTFMRGLNRGMNEWQAFDAAIGANDRAVAALDAEVRKYFETARPLDLDRMHDTLLAWADAEAATLPERGRFDFDAIRSSLVAWMADPARKGLARELDPKDVSVKVGRRGQGPIVRIDPLDGLGWEISFTRQKPTRGRSRGDREEPGEDRTWIPSVRWSLSG